jgi:hypothetical protein
MKKLLLLGLLVAGCRTEIQPLVKGEVARSRMRERNADCQFHDFPTATDVPEGAKSLGWTKVDRLATDELTFEALRKKICEMGGDAVSQMHWIRASGASVADPPVELEGNVWSLP